MVHDCLVPIIAIRLFNSCDSNLRPRSVTVVEGMPNRVLQPQRKAWAIASAVIEVRGMASGQSVNLST